MLRLLLALSLIPACTHASPLEELSVAKALMRYARLYPAYPQS